MLHWNWMFAKNSKCSAPIYIEQKRCCARTLLPLCCNRLHCMERLCLFVCLCVCSGESFTHRDEDGGRKGERKNKKLCQKKSTKCLRINEQIPRELDEIKPRTGFVSNGNGNRNQQTKEYWVKTIFRHTAVIRHLGPNWKHDRNTRHRFHRHFLQQTFCFSHSAYSFFIFFHQLNFFLSRNFSLSLEKKPNCNGTIQQYFKWTNGDCHTIQMQQLICI